MPKRRPKAQAPDTPLTQRKRLDEPSFVAQ